MLLCKPINLYVAYVKIPFASLEKISKNPRKLRAATVWILWITLWIMWITICSKNYAKILRKPFYADYKIFKRKKDCIQQGMKKPCFRVKSGLFRMFCLEGKPCKRGQKNLEDLPVDKGVYETYTDCNFLKFFVNGGCVSKKNFC